MGLCGKFFTTLPPASLHLCGSFSQAWFSALQSVRVMGKDLPTRNPSIQSPSSSAPRRTLGLEVGGSCKPDATRVQ